jgi:hypothetical protein
MKRVLAVSGRFPHKIFSIVAVVALVAFLLTLKPVAEIVKKGVESLGGIFPPMDIFRNTAANILLVALGYIALAIAAVIVIPIVKIAVTVAAISVVAYGLYNIYRTFTKRSVKNILPDMDAFPKETKEKGYGYGDTDLNRGK